MKSKTVRNWRTALLVAVTFSLALAVNSINASSEPTPQEAAAEGNLGAPAPPDGDPSETPPAIPALTPPPLNTTPGMEEIFRMARSGVSAEVLSAFVTKSGRAFNPSAEEIIYLKDLGVVPKTIADIIQTGTGETQLTREVAVGNFQEVENQNANLNSVASTDGANGQTTVNVTTQSHYAAAPQQLEDQAVAQAGPPQNESGAEVNIGYFKGALAPYGSWIYVEGVGNCWRPTVSVVNSSWRPYYDGGRWIYTDTGWYWLSDYSWGWAPFHYGRWHQSAGFGWVWAPGYTWGPAWVSWRRNSAYYGWAPLPAYRYGAGWGGSFGYYGSGWGISIGVSWGHYNWVPYRYCYGYYPRHYAAPHGRRRDIYNNSTVIKPTIIGDNNTVIINGPNARTVADASRTEIRRVNVRDVTNLRDPGPKDYIENGGRTLATFRPTLDSNQTRTTTTEARRGRDSASLQTTSRSSAATGTDTRRNAPTTAAQSTTSQSSIRSGTRSAAPAPTTQAQSSRRTSETLTATRTENIRRSANTSTSSQQSTARLAGQNTTVRQNPSYRVPAVQSTPILRNGRTIQYQAPVRHTPPVVSGGTRVESTRSRSTYQYPGSTAVTSRSRQAVRTPALSQFPSPTTRGTRTYAPTRANRPSYNQPSGAETLRSRPTSSYSTPTTSRMTIPASRPPTRSYTPSPQSYSRQSPAVSRPSISRSPARTSSPGYSRPRSTAPTRAPVSRSSGSGSRAPTRR